MTHITKKQFNSIAVGDSVEYLLFSGISSIKTVTKKSGKCVLLDNGADYPYTRIVSIIKLSTDNQDRSKT